MYVLMPKKNQKLTISKDFLTLFSKIQIPLHIFHDEKLSILEAIVTHLKEHHHLKFKEIALALNRDQRNIWTIYQRSKQKRGTHGTKP